MCKSCAADIVRFFGIVTRRKEKGGNLRISNKERHSDINKEKSDRNTLKLEDFRVLVFE